MSRWTHRGGRDDHAPDPHYNGNGKPAWWTCHAQTGKGRYDRCDEPLMLDGARPPLVGGVASETAPESDMSGQP